MVEEELDRYWKTVVDTIQDGIMIVDTDGVIVSVNKALETMMGLSCDALIGKKCSVLNCSIFPQVRETTGHHWCALFRDGCLSTRKCTLRKADGGLIHVLKNASILHSDSGEVLGAVETVTDITELIKKDHQIAAFRRELQSKDGFHGILGTSPAVRHACDLIADAAQSDAPVIIYGESGTGKELAAQAIHDIRARRARPFVKVNCAALSETILESELFGHVKGAFTGAYRSREGRFQKAHGGDIFLDEIGDLPPSTQVKLLRVLEEKVIERVGDSSPMPIDVRILSATNRRLTDLVARGSFRQDLYFRINVIPVTMPALRDRLEDIPVLSDAFIRRLQLKTGKQVEGIGADAMRALMDYPWPGNVRELRSAFEYAFVTCHEPIIGIQHLPPNIVQGANPLKTHEKSVKIVEQKKKLQLIKALEQTNGNQSKASEILGVSRVTVWNRMKKYGIRHNQA